MPFHTKPKASTKARVASNRKRGAGKKREKNMTFMHISFLLLNAVLFSLQFRARGNA